MFGGRYAFIIASWVLLQSLSVSIAAPSLAPISDVGDMLVKRHYHGEHNKHKGHHKRHDHHEGKPHHKEYDMESNTTTSTEGLHKRHHSKHEKKVEEEFHHLKHEEKKLCEECHKHHHKDHKECKHCF